MLVVRIGYVSVWDTVSQACCASQPWHHSTLPNSACLSSTWRPSECSRPCTAKDPSGGNSLSTLGVRTPRDRVDAGPGCGWQKRQWRQRGHLTIEHSRQQSGPSHGSHRTHHVRLDADHASLVRYLDEELSAKSESAVVWLALFGTIYCRGIPRYPKLRGFAWDEPGFSTATGSVGGTGDRPPEAGSLGQTCRQSACHVVRPLHEAIGNIEELRTTL